MYEVFLTRRVVGVEDFKKFFDGLMKIHRQGERIEMVFLLEANAVRVFLVTKRRLPHFIAGADGFTISATDEVIPKRLVKYGVRRYKTNETLTTFIEKCEARGAELVEMRIVLRKLAKSYSFGCVLVEEKLGAAKAVRLIGAGMGVLDLDLRKKFVLRKPEKYLNVAKTLDLMKTEPAGAVLKLKTYPYLNGNYYLNLNNIDFYKHTAVFGATGSGKTKFLCQMMEQIAERYGDNYHMLVIDPHDAMRSEIGGMDGVKVYDYSASERGLGLFMGDAEDIVSSVDMTMGLIKSMIGQDWNSRLERLTRASLYILIEKGELSFQNIRRLLTDTAYKNACINETRDYLPESLQEFFGQDYNELKTQHYDATFAKLLSFVDELQLTPAFYRKNDKRLDFELMENKVTLVSLSQTRLGEKAVKTLAGLIMNQLFMLGMLRKVPGHVIMMVDEVAVIENPILMRFLAEARKYNISVVLAGQYFSQISDELRTAIYANVANYWCFRLNYTDAELMSKYLDMELASETQRDFAVVRGETFVGDEREKAKMLAGLPAREVVVRVSRNGVLLPAVMGRSMDFVAKPEVKFGAKRAKNETNEARNNIPKKVNFTEAKSNILDLMREQSTSRRKVN